MKLETNYSLQSNNSFAINSVCENFYQIESLDDLKAIPVDVLKNAYVLGEGSNTLFTDNKAPNIIHPCFKGITVEESDDAYHLTVAAGENWHELVCFCIENNIYGLENLALIPGSVGAAPVQNIGAYGVELADYCTHVHWFDFKSQQVKTYTKRACKFSYRDSLFKHKLSQKGMITAIELRLPKDWQASLSYQGLDELSALEQPVTAKAVMEKVINLRQEKLPDPMEIPNAGSFFKNPVIEEKQFRALNAVYPSMPNYPQKSGLIKIAAGWLIEASGLKGYKINTVGVHDKQALVLVNFDNATGQDLVELAMHVQKQVYSEFSIYLTPEVRFVGAAGEYQLEKIQDSY